MTLKIISFSGEYRFLSNFYRAPIMVMEEGKSYQYPSVEHAYQALKTFDYSEREFFRGDSVTAGQAKRKGRQVKIRSDWNNVKIDIMGQLIYLKFSSHSNLKEKLLATNNAELIEGNTWGDSFWGMCPNEYGILTGQNNLGKILMNIRNGFKINELIG